MEKRHFIKNLCQQKVKTSFLSILIALNAQWVLRFRWKEVLYKLYISSYSSLLVWGYLSHGFISKILSWIPILIECSEQKGMLIRLWTKCSEMGMFRNGNVNSTLNKTWSFLLRISLINVNKSAENWGFIYIY